MARGILRGRLIVIAFKDDEVSNYELVNQVKQFYQNVWKTHEYIYQTKSWKFYKIQTQVLSTEDKIETKKKLKTKTTLIVEKEIPFHYSPSSSRFNTNCSIRID